MNRKSILFLSCLLLVGSCLWGQGEEDSPEGIIKKPLYITPASAVKMGKMYQTVLGDPQISDSRSILKASIKELLNQNNCGQIVSATFIGKFTPYGDQENLNFFEKNIGAISPESQPERVFKNGAVLTWFKILREMLTDKSSVG